MVEAVEGGDGAIELAEHAEGAGVGDLEGGGGHVLAGVGDHLGGGVDAGDAVAAGGQEAGEVAGAAADVEDAAFGREAGQPDALEYGEGEAVELLVPVAIVEPGEIIVECHRCG